MKSSLSVLRLIITPENPMTLAFQMQSHSFFMRVIILFDEADFYAT